MEFWLQINFSWQFMGPFDGWSGGVPGVFGGSRRIGEVKNEVTGGKGR